MMNEFAYTAPPDAPENPFDRLCWIMDKLLAPGGCPWDRKQTHESLMQYLIEESYEVLEAIETSDLDHLKEELGDVALQVVFHSALARRDGEFCVDEVLNGISEKLIRRHPHVFGQTKVDGAEQVLENWEEIKKRERSGKKKDNSLLAGVPKSLPALQKAHRMQDKARRVGYDWPTVQGALDKVQEEFQELSAELEQGPDGKPTPEAIDEFGDVLFAMTNVARMMGIQSEEALQGACAKFGKRFRHIEKRAEENKKELQEMSLEEMEVYWEEAKKIRE